MTQSALEALAVQAAAAAIDAVTAAQRRDTASRPRPVASVGRAQETSGTDRLACDSADGSRRASPPASQSCTPVHSDISSANGPIDSKKRRIEESETTGEAPTDERKAMTTYAARREEKAELLRKISESEVELADWKRRVVTQQDILSMARVRATNSFMREARFDQEIAFAKLQAMLYKHTRECQIGPIESNIQLGRDREERHAALNSMRHKKLRNAKRFLELRCFLYSPSSPFTEFHQFETLAGDYCAVHCTREQYEEAQSVKQVFDHLLFSIRNIEINISEKLGYLTIREDDDSEDGSIFQNRLVSTTPMGVQLESNSVLFSGYFDHDLDNPEAGAYGMFALESASSDELYPYRPKERIRRDTTVMMLVRSFTRTIKADDGSEWHQPGVVMTRWHMSKVHKPQMPVAASVWNELKVCVEQWRKAMQLTERGGRAAL